MAARIYQQAHSALIPNICIQTSHKGPNSSLFERAQSLPPVGPTPLVRGPIPPVRGKWPKAKRGRDDGRRPEGIGSGAPVRTLGRMRGRS